MTTNVRPWSPPQIFWSAAIAVIVWSAVGFSWFGHGFDWVTRGHAKQMATAAVVDSLATICVAKARSTPDSAASIEKLSSLSTWKRREFVEAEHWANMPGSDSAQHGVAEACVAKLLAT